MRQNFLHANNEDFDQTARMCSVQSDLSVRWARIAEGTFSHGVAHLL